MNDNFMHPLPAGMKDQTKAILEALGNMQAAVFDLQADMKVVKATAIANSKYLHDIDRRLPRMEARVQP